jgi:hypothetical protein
MRLFPIFVGDVSDVHNCLKACSVEPIAMINTLTSTIEKYKAWRTQFKARHSKAEKSKDRLYTKVAKHI